MLTSIARLCAFASLAALVAGCATTPDTARSGLHVSTNFPAGAAKMRHSGALETIYFASGSAEISDEARKLLDDVARRIRLDRQSSFAVTGHTDTVGSERANRELGFARAQAALDALIGLGVRPDQLVALVSEGEEAPVAFSGPADALNRRVTISLYLPAEDNEDATLALAIGTGGGHPSADKVEPGLGESDGDGDAAPDDQDMPDAPDAPDASDTSGEAPPDNNGKGRNSPTHTDAGKGNGGGDGGDPGRSGDRNKAGESD